MKKTKNRICGADRCAALFGRRVLVFLLLMLMLILTGCKKSDTEVQGEQEETAPHGYQGGATEKIASAADLYCLEFCSYSGQFMEDNTFEDVENVAAMWLENRSDEFLDLATITYDVGDGKEAVFEVKGLPQKSKVLVLEKNRMILTGREQFAEEPDVQASFNKSAITSTDNLSVSQKDGVLTVTNMTRNNLKNVAVYYKLTDENGNFLGGAAYVSSFGDLKAQETKEKDAPLFSQNAKIVRYSYQVG